MKPSRRFIRRWVPLIGLIAAAYVLRPIFWTPLDYRFYNYFQSKRPVPPWTQVVVIAIDDQTRAKVFSNPIFPLSRHVDDHARVTKQLDVAGVRAIVFDLRLTEDVFDTPVDSLAEAFRSSKKVYLVMSLVETGRISDGLETDAPRMIIRPHPDLAAACNGVLVADMSIDPDGVLRRFNVDPRLEQLGLDALPARLSGVTTAHKVPIEFPSEDRPIPRLSYYDVWRGAENLAPSLVGKIAFVGSVLDESVDYVSVPRIQRLGGNRTGFVLPGVTALAATTETLLRGTPIRDAPWPIALLWNFFWCIAAVALAPSTKPVRGAVLYGAVLTLAVLATGVLHVVAGLVFPTGLLAGCLAFCGVYAVVTAHVEAEKTIVTEQAEIRRVHKEMETARNTQKRFLPRAIPAVEGYDLWGINVSSLEVSGDYFDIIDTGKNAPLILAIADVSGKGLPAALVMSNVQAALHSHILQGNFDLARTAKNLNSLVYENTSEETFVSMFIGELTKETGVFRYVRAGHDVPFVVAEDASVKRLAKGGLVLGFVPGIDYEIGEEQLRGGDTVCLYTDGVTEARNAVGEEFQTDKLMELLKNARDKEAKEIAELIVQTVHDFTKLKNQADDVTVTILRVRKKTS